MRDVYTIFPERLRAAMKYRGFKASDFELSCCSATTLTKYLYGKHLPNAYILRDIAVFLNVSSDYLLGLADRIIEKPSWIWKDGDCICSNCHGFGETTFHYCPTCGERMNIK